MKQLVSTGIILALLGSNIIIGSQYIHDNKEYAKELNKQKEVINEYKINKRKQYEQIKSSGIQIKVLNQIIDQLKRQKQQVEKKLASRNKAKPSPPSLKPKQQEKSQQVFEVTAYTSGIESTGKTPSDNGYGLTASGTNVQQGKTVACPSNLSFGTKLYIQNVGYRTCQDRGAAIKANRLDLYVESLNDAIQFGRKQLIVTILN